MSNISIFNQNTNIVARGPRNSELAKAFAGSGGGMRRIQLSNKGTFKRVFNGEQVGKVAHGNIDVIIVKALPKVSREYYAAAYDAEAKPTLPDCWSNLGDKPEEGAPNPQAASCAMCPMNADGSGMNGKGKACRFQRRLGVLIHGDPTNELYQIKIPSKSLFGKGSGNQHPFESYAKFLAANSEALDTVVTNIAYDEEADGLEVIFSPQRVLDDEEYALVQQLQSDPRNNRFCTMTVAQVDGAKPEMIAAKPSKIVRSEEPDEDEEEVVAPKKTEAADKPVKRVTKKENSVAPKNLAETLDVWGEDDE